MTNFNNIVVRFFRESATTATGKKAEWVGVFCRVGTFFTFHVAIGARVVKKGSVKNGV
jgi:hypothetical protein